MKATLLLATYEMPRHLELVLTGLDRQTYRDFEIIICDDGSSAQTKEIIEKFSGQSSLAVKHLWQEHQGFRKCKILNAALSEAQGDTLIFLDGDCVPHRDFVYDHVTQQETGRFLAGRRVELGETISSGLTAQEVKDGFFDFPRPKLIWSVFKGETSHLQRTLRFSIEAVRKKLGMEKIDDLKGCNYSVAKSDLLAINGFDEDYEGYGREDTDIEIRLTNLGLMIKSLKGLALQFHVWHPRREFTPKNDDRLEIVRSSKKVRCKNGLIKE